MYIKDYFFVKYAKKITDNFQPLFVSLGKNKETGLKDVRRYFVPELMRLTGIDEDYCRDTKQLTLSTKLDANGKFIILKLIEKKNKCDEIIHLLSSNFKKERKGKDGKPFMLDSANEKKLQWGIQFHQMKDFKAGKLESPEIIFKHTNGNVIYIN